jgi:hypothetical protein
MTDPKRLSLASDSEVERQLLQAGRVHAPPGSKEHALLVASSALGVAGAAAAGKGTALGIAKAGSIVSLKWIGIIGLAAIGTVAGAAVVHEVRESRAPIAVEVTPALARRPSALARTDRTPENGEGWTPAPIDPATLAPASAEVVNAPPPPTLGPDAATASTLPAELAVLEHARGAIAAGDPALSLSLLDGYAGRFPRGSMGPEATMLRIEALVKVGNRGAAARTADALLAGDPGSPYAARVQSLLGTSAMSNP